jgi:hypothetical protein
MKTVLFVLFLFAVGFSFSYQNCILIKIKTNSPDTLCVCKNVRTKTMILVKPERIKQRPLTIGSQITVRNKPYKRFKKIQFNILVGDLVVPEAVE